MQGFPFYEKPMRIAFAKEDSDVVAKEKGTYVERPHRAPARAQKKKKVGVFFVSLKNTFFEKYVCFKI